MGGTGLAGLSLSPWFVVDGRSVRPKEAGSWAHAPIVARMATARHPHFTRSPMFVLYRDVAGVPIRRPAHLASENRDTMGSHPVFGRLI
jgi:hypothetical protein